MNIAKAIRDRNLFRPFFGNSLRSWRPWLAALRTLYGLPLRESQKALVSTCSGCEPVGDDLLPPGGFASALFLTGRRSGKSRIAAVAAAYEAALAGHERKLSKGEKGLVAVISPTRRQSRIVRGYIQGIFRSTPLLRREIERETAQGFDLANGVSIEILAGDYRTVRGFTLLAAVVDEICFFGLEAESKIKNDAELVRALRPGLATVGGKLIAISSPYARRGWAYQTWKRNWGKSNPGVLVWNCSSRTMNPTLPQSVVDEALREDLAAAKSEYLGEWRDDVSAYLPRAVIEQSVVSGRLQLLPDEAQTYFAFADLSGGRNESAALAIGHRESRKVIVDCLREWKSPFSPQYVVHQMAADLQRYGLRRVTGDAYAAEFTVGSFQREGIKYNRAKQNKSELFLELLPRLCSGEIELLDNERLIEQLANLERRTRSGGKDTIDHPSGGKDDLANVVAGVATSAAKNTIVVGALRLN